MRVPRGIQRLVSSDPGERLLGRIELVQAKADYSDLRRVLQRLEKRTERGWIHVTDAAGACERLMAASLLGISPPPVFTPPQTQRILDNGAYMHLRWQSYFVRLGREDKSFNVDVGVVLRRWPLIGEADVLVEHNELGLWVVELKSINASEFRSLVAPKDSHVLQASCYAHLVGRGCGVMVLYENKDNQDVKVYWQRPERNAWRELWARASAVANEVITGQLPGLCPSCPDPGFCESIAVSPEALEHLRRCREETYGRRHHRPRR